MGEQAIRAVDWESNRAAHLQIGIGSMDGPRTPARRLDLLLLGRLLTGLGWDRSLPRHSCRAVLLLFSETLGPRLETSGRREAERYDVTEFRRRTPPARWTFSSACRRTLGASAVAGQERARDNKRRLPGRVAHARFRWRPVRVRGVILGFNGPIWLGLFFSFLNLKYIFK